VKYNLKTRPQLVGYGEEYDKLNQCIQEISEWFEGCERELREILQSLEPHTAEHILVQEILGEI
jgi:hypothetical protein